MDYAGAEVVRMYPKKDPIPQYFGPADVDRWGKVVTELVAEVWALSERTRRLEQSLASNGITLQEDEPDEAHVQRRLAYLKQTLWALFDEERALD